MKIIYTLLIGGLTIASAKSPSITKPANKKGAITIQEYNKQLITMFETAALKAKGKYVFVTDPRA